MTSFLKTTDSFQQGARTMPGRYYTSDQVLREEQEKIFAREWIAVGRATALPDGGDYLIAEVAGESIIVVRDRSGELRAFYNVCRHRGTRLCEQSAGRFQGSIQCPYHAWTYGLDGRLIGAPHMQEAEGFDRKDYPLHPVALEVWEGFLFVSLAERPAPFRDAFAPMLSRFSPYRLAGLVTVRRIEYDVQANWKLVMQNYSECLHCPTIHPELSAKLPYTSGANDLTDGAFLGGYMEIKAPHESATMSGRRCALPLGELAADDERRGYYYTLFPTMMLSLHPDYAVFYTVHPVSAARTRVVCDWMVNPAAPQAAGYDIADAETFWDMTNRQDWHICEQSQRGVSSRVYQPGPYSPRESIPAAWDRYYLRMMAR